MNADVRRELGVALVLVAFGGWVIALARQITAGVRTDPLGPAAFPIALGAGIALCGLLLAASTLIFRGRPPDRAGLFADAGDEEESETGPFSPVRLAGAVVATAVYLAIFEPLGYLIATPVYVAVIMLIHGGAARRSLVVGPFLATALLYVTFRFGLLIPIPLGILEGVLRW